MLTEALHGRCSEKRPIGLVMELKSVPKGIVQKLFIEPAGDY
jgi:hypothetical protein